MKVEVKTDRLYPSAPFQNKSDEFEQKLENKLNDVKRFNDSINNIKGTITYFKDKKNKFKKKNRKHKTRTILLKSFDTFVIINTTSSSTTLSLTRICLIVIPTTNSIHLFIVIG